MENNTDISQVILDTINKIFETLFSSIDNNLYAILDKITFINSDILSDKNFEFIMGTSTSNGILLIANSFLLAFILYYAIRYLLSHFTYSQIESPSSFVIKIIICGICMNCSFFVINMILDLNSNISLAIQSLGKDLTGKQTCFSELITIINSNISINTSSMNIFSIDGLIKSTLTISLLNLVLSYSLRYVMLKVLILIAPFSILSLCLNSTSWFFKTWLRNLFALLFIQIIVSIILLILFSMNYSSSNLITKFIYIGGIYALIQANSFVRDFVGGVSTNVTQIVKNFHK